MTRSDLTVLVTRLDQVMTLTRKNFRWLWLDSDVMSLRFWLYTDYRNDSNTSLHPGSLPLFS